MRQRLAQLWWFVTKRWWWWRAERRAERAPRYIYVEMLNEPIGVTIEYSVGHDPRAVARELAWHLKIQR